MADSSSLRIIRGRESSLGVIPVTPNARAMRVTGETLKFALDNVESEEIRSDGQVTDVIKVMSRANGSLPFELSYGAFDSEIELAMLNTWVKIAEIENSAADTEITDAGTTTDTYAVASGGAAFKAGHLCRASGFTTAANNKLFKVASSTATTVVGSSLSLTAEVAPPKGAKLKVVGFQGASGDITATASGLGSTSLDFTTLGLSVGQWIKIGGSATGDKFATAVLNGFARITAIAATALTLDNRPTGWTTDAGSGKTLQVWVGDYIRQGSQKLSNFYETAPLSQDTPQYSLYKGMMCNSLSLNLESSAIVTGSIDFLGFSEEISTSSVDGTAPAAPTADVMTAAVNTGRVYEAGAAIAGANYNRSISFSINNNLREQPHLFRDTIGGIGIGTRNVTGSLMTYFGDSTIYNKYVNNTATSLNFVLPQDGQAYVTTFPKVKLTDADKNASARSQDIMANFSFTALHDPVTLTQVQFDKFEEFAE